MRKRIRFIFLLLVLLIFIPKVASADSMKYSVKANIPENQLDKSKTYFDLQMRPGAVQNISLTVSNSDTKEVVLAVIPNTATTNKNGVIDYSQANSRKDSSLKVNFADLVKGPHKVPLAPNETKEVIYELNMPIEKFNGLLLGGFYVSKENSEAGATEKNSVQIRNEYSYVIAVSLTEATTEIKPELALNQVKPSLENYHTVVTANLQNRQPKLVGNLKVEAEISKKGSKKILHQTKKESMSMAPNSNFDFPISWDNQQLKAGKYTLRLKATTSDGSWKFTKNFEIKRQQSKSLNKQAVELEQDYSWIIIAVGVLFLIMALLLIALIMRTVNQEKKLKKTESDNHSLEN